MDPSPGLARMRSRWWRYSKVLALWMSTTSRTLALQNHPTTPLRIAQTDGLAIRRARKDVPAPLHHCILGTVHWQSRVHSPWATPFSGPRSHSSP